MAAQIYTFTDNIGMETHGPESNNQPKCAQIIAAEACLALDGNEQTITMLQQTPRRQIMAEEVRFSAAAIVSYLSSTEHYSTLLFRPNQAVGQRHSSIISMMTEIIISYRLIEFAG